MHLSLAIAPTPTLADRVDGIRAARPTTTGSASPSWADALVDAAAQEAYTRLARAAS